jgi:hypothetical protein
VDSVDANVQQEQERCTRSLEYILHIFDEILPILCQRKGNNEKALYESMEPVMDPMIEMIMGKITDKNENTPLALAFSMEV